MKLLEVVHLVQFSFFEADSFQTRGNLTLLGPNGVGKTSILDAIQIAMLGAHGNYVAYNSQSVSSRRKRTLKDYCLGAMHSSDESQPGSVRKRDHAHSYITLVFRDTVTGEPISAGICLSATVLETDHRLRGLYVAPGVEISLKDHLQAVDEGTVPIDWSTFEFELQRRAKAIGRTAHVSVHPESYIDELLHAIQPNARHIDRHAFVRSFKKSVNLRDIEDVNDFVRDYLIDAQPINKQTALTQINRFKQLRSLIRETEEQIERLGQIRKDHEQLLNAYRRRDTINAVKAMITVELEKDHIQELTTERSAIEDELSRLGPQSQLMYDKKKQLTQEIQELIEKIAADPATANSEQTKKLWSVLNQRLSENGRNLYAWNLQIRQTLQNLVESLPSTDAQVVAVIERLLNKWESFAKKEDDFAEVTLLHETKEYLTSLKGPISQLRESAKQAESAAETTLKSLLGQAKATARGAGQLSAAVGTAIEIFREHGIDANPVSALVEIKDRSWQAAIEAFLARHRESLVIEKGKEREAVRLLRKFGQHADWLFEVTVVQPAHLDAAKHSSPAKESVASLIKGTDEVAVTYIRQILGSMRCVETEEELERHPRSLTRDGMVSANGGTRRLRIPDSGRWLIGSKLSDSQQNALHQAVVQAQRDLEIARNRCAHLEKTDESIRETLRDVDSARYVEATNAVRDTRSQLSALPDPASVMEPKRLRDLRAMKNQADESLNRLETELNDLQKRQAGLKAIADERQRQLTAANERLSQLNHEYESAAKAMDFDAQLQATLHGEVTTGQNEEAWIATCEDIRTKAEDRMRQIQNRVLPAFQQFLDHYNVSLIDERSDWRKAKSWVEARILKLEASELVTYKQEADNALNAAEEAFRRDVAYRLREAMHRLEHGIKQLNDILSICPVFSSNERYKFVAKPAEAHKKVYEFIQHIDDWEGSTGSLFAGVEDARAEVIALLESSASADGKRIENPLEDYRLLYNFDLVILQEGKEVDRLSKRIGVASNGEHRVPFYVIAGASLAAAYRLNTGKSNDGAALMLLDEAFYGMDSQNSFAAAEFLRSVGLQLIMAGPEADQGKLTPMTHTLYELVRYGGDVFYEHDHFTPEMHVLMTSDMPMLNPQLIDDAESASL